MTRDYRGFPFLTTHAQSSRTVRRARQCARMALATDATVDQAQIAVEPAGWDRYGQGQ